MQIHVFLFVIIWHEYLRFEFVLITHKFENDLQRPNMSLNCFNIELQWTQVRSHASVFSFFNHTLFLYRWAMQCNNVSIIAMFYFLKIQYEFPNPYQQSETKRHSGLSIALWQRTFAFSNLFISWLCWPTRNMKQIRWTDLVFTKSSDERLK